MSRANIQNLNRYALFLIFYLSCFIFADGKIQISQTLATRGGHSNGHIVINNINQAAAAPSKVDHNHHSMSMTSLIINIIADLCPHGMLPLAYGISRGPTGVVPALVMLVESTYTLKKL